MASRIAVPLVALCLAISPSVGATGSIPSPDLDERFHAVLPAHRPFLGSSLVGGDRLLIDRTRGEQAGEPNRIVNHVPFADVDRDGTDDVLELDLDLREAHPTYGFMGLLRLNTLSGTTGHLIARYEMDFHSGVPDVVLARVGPKAAPGVLVFLNRFISSTDSPTGKFEVTAVTGAGEELWSREWVSTSTSTASRYFAVTGLASPTGLLQDRGGGATDLLLGVYDYAGAVIRMTPVVVRGRDGSLLEHDAVTVPWIETTPIPTSAPDLDGDRRQDVLVVDTTGLGQGLRANSSASGEELWHSSEVASGWGHVTADVGNVTGDRTRDFVLGEPVRLVDGASGEVRWERSGGWYVMSYGDVDGDGRADILAGDGFFNEQRFGASMKVINSKGRILGKKSYIARRSEPGWSFIIQEDAGDTSGDGVGEAFLHLLHYGENETVERRFVIDPVTANPLHQGDDLFALNGKLDGGADDLARVRRIDGAFRIAGVDGRTGRPFWRKSVPVSKTRLLAFHPRAAAGSRTERNVVMTFFDRHSARAVLMDGRTGRRLWSRTLGPTDG